jgi:hypothetical protein
MNTKRWLATAALCMLVFGLRLTHSQAQQQSQTKSNDAQASSSTSQTPDSNQQATTPSQPKPHTYTNKAGQRIQSPTKSSSGPAGATAQCRDGSYSFSQNHRGTCSHHGGVAKWLK